jgi:predicted transcriptional regulator
MTDEEFWDDMIEQDSIGTLTPGEMTAEMYAEKIGKSVSHTYGILRGWLKKGMMTRRPVVVNGRRNWAYRPAVQKRQKAPAKAD